MSTNGKGQLDLSPGEKPGAGEFHHFDKHGLPRDRYNRIIRGFKGRRTPGSGILPRVSYYEASYVHRLAKKLRIDPFEIILHFANGDARALGYQPLIDQDGKVLGYPVIEPEVRLRAAIEAATYLQPKPRTVDVPPLNLVDDAAANGKPLPKFNLSKLSVWELGKLRDILGKATETDEEA